MGGSPGQRDDGARAGLAGGNEQRRPVFKAAFRTGGLAGSILLEDVQGHAFAVDQDLAQLGVIGDADGRIGGGRGSGLGDVGISGARRGGTGDRGGSGRGGGLSDMFGGAGTTALGSTAAERNLTRITTIMAILWVGTVISLSFLLVR